jgi:hypothetical protein
MSFVATVIACIFLSAVMPALSQNIEDVVVRDLQSLGYDLQKENGYYSMTKSGSMYETSSVSFMLTVTKNGKHTFLNLMAPARVFNQSDTSIISAMYAALLAGSDVPCASYALEVLDDNRHVLFLKRSIEGECYSKMLVKQIAECIQRELSTWSGFDYQSGLHAKPNDNRLNNSGADGIKKFIEMNSKSSK